MSEWHGKSIAASIFHADLDRPGRIVAFELRDGGQSAIVFPGGPAELASLRAFVAHAIDDALTAERRAWAAALNLDPGTTAQEAAAVIQRRIESACR